MLYNDSRISLFWDQIKQLEENEINKRMINSCRNLLNKHHVIMDVDNKKLLIEDMHQLIIFASTCYTEMFDRWLMTGDIEWNEE